MADKKIPASTKKVRSRRSVITPDIAPILMFDLSKVTVHNRSVYDGMLVRPQNHVGDLSWRDESPEAIHGAQAMEYGLVIAHMLTEHTGIGKAGADHCGMNAPSHEILAGCPHHPQLSVLADNITECACDGLLR
jgi:hypothetical protein